MEIKIQIEVTDTSRKELKKIIETCKQHGMELIREGGGIMPGYKGYYATLSGARWQKIDTGERQLNKHDVSNNEVEVCRICGVNESIGGGYVCCLQCMEDSVR